MFQSPITTFSFDISTFSKEIFYRVQELGSRTWDLRGYELNIRQNLHQPLDIHVDLEPEDVLFLWFVPCLFLVVFFFFSIQLGA